MSNANELSITSSGTLLRTTVGEYQTQLMQYLELLGLPQNSVLVGVDQRSRVIQNVPLVLEAMPTSIKAESYYISKFIAACGAGLFDAALNYIWNETIENLKEKIGLFDLEYFKSTISDEGKKIKILSVEDLVILDDWEIVRGCQATGIISDIGFRHLDYIRGMRNWASAAHPNQVKLTGIQLISWLETCIIEVIGKEPSLPAIEAKRLLNNIREKVLSPTDVPIIQSALRQTPQEIVSSIFRTIYGMFCDPNGKVETKNNIRLIANDIWSVLPESSRREAGVKYANWAANADIERKTLSREFLEQVAALSYLPPDTLTLEMANTIEDLQKAHFAFYNFYNEASHAKILRKLIPANGQIPETVRQAYVKTIILCMVGNGYGVACDAYPVYLELYDKFTDNEFKELLKLFLDNDFSSRMQFPDCKTNIKEIINKANQRTTNESLKRVIAHIKSQTDEQLPGLGKTTEYKRLLGLMS